MLELLTADMFTTRIGDRFRLIVPPGQTIEVELIEATVLGSGSGQGRQPFSILFQGPPVSAVPQGIYHLEHSTLGSLEIFLVPLGPRDGKMVYQAIFN